MKRVMWQTSMIALVLLLALGTVPVQAQMELPHAFYGDLEINGAPAPAGTKVEARGEGVTTGIEGNPIMTTGEGRYGGPGAFDAKLVVQGEIEEGTSLTFYVDGVSTGETFLFDSGTVTELSLSVTISQPGPVAPAAAPSMPTLQITLFGTTATYAIGSNGEIQQTIQATSQDGMLTITIPAGTIALDKNGNPLATLEVVVDESPPDPPEGAHIIGLAYDLKPDGATFNPPIILTWRYDADALPEGVAEEDLVIAYYDETTSEWVELDSVVDTENDTVTASIEHFTCFALLGTVTPPVEEEVAEEEPAVAKEVVEEEVAEEEVVEEEVAEEEVAEEEVAEEEVAEEEDETEPTGIRWPMIGGIIAAVTVVAGLLAFFVFTVKGREVYLTLRRKG